MTNDKLIEAMARAIHKATKRDGPSWFDLDEEQETCRTEARAALAAAEAAGYRLVPVERLQCALEQVQNAMFNAYNGAYLECCGRYGVECCGDPEPAWSAEDQRIMNVLHPVQQKLSAMLAAPDHSEQARPMVGAWVPVSERMPEKGVTVLVLHDFGRAVTNHQHPDYGKRYGHRLTERASTGFMSELLETGHITHWMPLPQAPEVGQ